MKNGDVRSFDDHISPTQTTIPCRLRQTPRTPYRMDYSIKDIQTSVGASVTYLLLVRPLGLKIDFAHVRLQRRQSPRFLAL